MTRTTRLLASTLLLGAGLTLTACGGGTSGQTTPATHTGADGAAPSASAGLPTPGASTPSSSSNPTASSTGSDTSAPPLTEARAQQLAAGITSGTADGVRSVLDMNPAQTLDDDGVKELATLAPMTIDVSSFHDNGDGTATVLATVRPSADNATGRWEVLLIAKNGQWLMSQTSPA